MVFNILGVQFHMLDENKEYGLYAPQNKQNSMWCNLLFEDIENIFNKCKEKGFSVIQPLTELKEFGVINAMYLTLFLTSGCFIKS